MDSFVRSLRNDDVIVTRLRLDNVFSKVCNNGLTFSTDDNDLFIGCLLRSHEEFKSLAMSVIILDLYLKHCENLTEEN